MLLMSRPDRPDGAQQAQHALTGLLHVVAHQDVPLLHVEQLGQQRERVIHVLELRHDLAKGVEDVRAIEHAENLRQLSGKLLGPPNHLRRDQPRQRAVGIVGVGPRVGEHLQGRAHPVEIERAGEQGLLAQVHQAVLEAIGERRIRIEAPAAEDAAAAIAPAQARQARGRARAAGPARARDHAAIVGDRLLLQPDERAHVGDLALGEAAAGASPRDGAPELTELRREVADLAGKRSSVPCDPAKGAASPDASGSAVEVLRCTGESLQLPHESTHRASQLVDQTQRHRNVHIRCHLRPSFSARRLALRHCPSWYRPRRR